MKMLAKVIGKGRPLVLVPGGLTGWLSWEPHAERLSANRKVIRVQLLNVQWGLENRQLPADYSVKTESTALAETLSGLGFKRPVDIVAWSYGALITLDFALDHPDSIRTLTLIEPSALWVLHATMGLDAEAQQHVATLQKIYGDISEDQLEQFASAVGLCPPGQSCLRFLSGRFGWSIANLCEIAPRYCRMMMTSRDCAVSNAPFCWSGAQVQPSSSTRLYMGSPRSFLKPGWWKCQQAMHRISSRGTDFLWSWHRFKIIPSQ